MITVKARLVGVFQTSQALLVQIGEWELIAIDPVEDAKLHWRHVHPRFGVIRRHLFASIHPYLNEHTRQDKV
jgi:hypothetical protein